MFQPERLMGYKEVLPYFLSDYWDGAYPGTRKDKYPGCVAGKKEEVFANDVLKDYLDRVDGRFSLQRYGWDQAFDPGEHEPGAIAAFRWECASVKFPEFTADICEEKGLMVPAINKSLPLSKNFAEAAVFARDPRSMFVYQSLALWGIVVYSKREKGLRLAQPSLKSIAYTPPNCNVHGPMTMHEEIVVGKTIHSRTGAQRVTALELCAYGQPEKQEKRVFGWLGKRGLAGA